MKRFKQKLELAIYGYDPRQYMPIRRDGKLTNRVDFIDYKINCLRRRINAVR